MADKTDFRFHMGDSRIARFLPVTVLAVLTCLVLINPFLWQAKTLFFLCAVVLLIYYRRRWQRQQAFAQLRYTNGVLLLVFNDGSEPELIHLTGQQRILPWLVELEFRRENGRKECWGIVFDAMDKNSFRELKVFIQTHHYLLMTSS